jgi:acetolactate synthase-1/2/3 large subunit
VHGDRQALAAKLQAPVIPLESPRGLKDPSLGRFAELLPASDLLVLAGKPLDFTLGFGRANVLGSQPVVVLDPDAAVLDRAHRLLGPRLALAVQCDAAALLQNAAQTAAGGGAMPHRFAWIEEVSAAVAFRELRAPAGAGKGGISPRELCEQVQRQLESVPEPVLVCDGGEFGQWAQAFCRAPLRIINGTSGAIGGGICYAIAAKIARPDATVIALMGDGSSGFHFMEFDTAVRESAAFVAVIGNDLRWNAEHVIQLRTYGADRLIGCELAASARYHEAAASLGGFGAAVQSREELERALQTAIASKLPACVNVTIAGQPAPTFSAAAASASAH